MRFLAATTVTVLCFNVISATAEQANSTRGTKQEQDACTPDVYRLCSDETPDEKRIVLPVSN
jgi:hypothetical protein